VSKKPAKSGVDSQGVVPSSELQPGSALGLRFLTLTVDVAVLDHYCGRVLAGHAAFGPGRLEQHLTFLHGERTSVFHDQIAAEYDLSSLPDGVAVDYGVTRGARGNTDYGPSELDRLGRSCG